MREVEVVISIDMVLTIRFMCHKLPGLQTPHLCDIATLLQVPGLRSQTWVCMFRILCDGIDVEDPDEPEV